LTYRKKLIEVALPLDDINAESAREKSIRHDHPSTLHLWWARRPLAACRAVLFASLIDDPSEPGAPPELLQRMDELPTPEPGCASGRSTPPVRCNRLSARRMLRS
jgi:adenine-specific DNA methylase